jgi:hypothetical protein
VRPQEKTAWKWVRPADAVEADVHRSLEAHDRVMGGLADLLKKVA